MSFLINKDERESNLQDLVNSTKNDINQYFNNGNEQFKTFDFPVLKGSDNNTDDVTAMLDDILSSLVSSLPQMDKELIDNFRNTLDLSDLKSLIEKILSDVKMDTSAAADHTRFDDLREKLLEDLKEDLMNLYENDDSPYSCSNSADIDDKALTKEVKEIEKQVEDHIKGDFWVVPQVTFRRYDKWEDWAERANRGKDGSWLSDECHRLWTSIIKDYEKLDETIFSKKLTELKSDIVNVFKTNTGNLVTKDGVEAIDEIIATLEKEGFKDKDPMLDAFKYLRGLKIDFRQNVYPYFFKEGINEVLHFQYGETITPKGKNGIADYREQLEISASETNNTIAKSILEHDFLDYYAYCSVMTFTERLVLSNEKSHDYKTLCVTFCDKMYPDEFGAQSNRAIMRELKTALDSVIELIDKF